MILMTGMQRLRPRGQLDATSFTLRSLRNLEATVARFRKLECLDCGEFGHAQGCLPLLNLDLSWVLE